MESNTQNVKIISNTAFIASLMADMNLSVFDLKQLKPSDQQKSDSAMLIAAVITGAAPNLGVLITGIFSLLGKSKDRHVRITGSNGGSIEFPADYDQDKIDALIEKANKLGAVKVQIL